MRKLFLGVVAGLVVLSAAPAMATIVGTKHDLSSTGGLAVRGTGDNGQVCVYCHTPHNGTTGFAAPLWNKGQGSASYTIYSSSTMQNTVAQPGAISKACLACHDGAASVGVVNNIGGSSATIAMTTQAGAGATYTGGVMQSGTAYMVGTDLSNDHPVGMTVVDNADTGIELLATMKTGGMVFFGASANTMECATCHNVHEQTPTSLRYFLRKDNAASALCTTCHKK